MANILSDFAEDILRESALLTSYAPFEESQLETILASEYNLSGTMIRLASEKDETFRLHTQAFDYVVKISAPGERPGVVNLQTAAMLHLEKRAPDLPIQRVVRTRAGATEIELSSRYDRRPRILRVFRFVTGTPLANILLDRALLTEAGRTLAQIDDALADFRHPYEGRLLVWDPQHLGTLRWLTNEVEDTQNRSMADEVFEKFVKYVEPALPGLRHQVIHGDFSPHNVIIDSATRRIAGVIDFGDTVRTPRIFELAAPMANLLGRPYEAQPWAAAADFIAGYRAVRPVPDATVRLLADVVPARLVLRALLAAWRARRSPDRREYVTSHAHDDWANLGRALSIGRDEICRILDRTAQYA